MTIYHNLKKRTKERIARGPGWLEHVMQFALIIASIVLTYSLASSPATNTAQNSYTEKKIDKYITFAGFLRDGRNPHGSQHEIDILPVHKNADTLTNWWSRIDNFYQENILFFDDASRKRYQNLNQLVFDQIDSLKQHPDASTGYRHTLKQPLADACDSFIKFFRDYLDNNYSTESHSKFKF